MAKTPTNPDITVRGGIVNVPPTTTPTTPPRHQPDTPRTKKHTKTKTDHIIPDAQTTAPTKQPEPASAEAPKPTPDESETDSSD